jgi:Putative auto-transporter adhesin, head GIN domain
MGAGHRHDGRLTSGAIMTTTRDLHSSFGTLRAWLGSCLWLVLVLPLALACQPVQADVVVGNGKATSESRSAAEFNGIALSGGSMSLKLRQGSPASVVVHGDANLLPLIETVVDGGQTLQLRWQRGTSVRTQSPTWVEVVAPQVHAVTSTGSGDIEVDTMKVPRLALSIKGSGDVRAKALSNDELSIGVAGSGGLHLAGRTARLAINLSGSGSVDAGDLRADDVTVGIAGSGDATVFAAQKLVASIAGSGNLWYSGEPSVQRSIAGSGSVRRR